MAERRRLSRLSAASRGSDEGRHRTRNPSIVLDDDHSTRVRPEPGDPAALAAASDGDGRSPARSAQRNDSSPAPLPTEPDSIVTAVGRGSMTRMSPLALDPGDDAEALRSTGLPMGGAPNSAEGTTTPQESGQDPDTPTRSSPSWDSESDRADGCWSDPPPAAAKDLEAPAS